LRRGDGFAAVVAAFGNDGAQRFGNRTGQGREAWPTFSLSAEHEADRGCRNRESSRIAPGCIPEQNGGGEKRKAQRLALRSPGGGLVDVPLRENTLEVLTVE
jgi:hypothetical protein